MRLPKLDTRLISTNSVVPCSPKNAILDFGTTGNFVTPEDASRLTNPVTVDDGPVVLSASGNPMVSTI